MNTDRIVPLWDYPSTSELQSDGSAPVAVYLRTPPDLYFGERKTLKLHLDYRYNAVALANESTLRIDANGSMVQQLPMPHEDNPSRMLSADRDVPIVDMRPFANTFLYNFYFQIAKKGHCEDTPPINLQGAILRSSYLDLKGLHHWATMPNLELFFCQRGLSVYALCRPGADKGHSAAECHSGRGGLVSLADGILRRADRLFGDTRAGGGRG